MMNLSTVRFALVAFFVATTGCAATADDTSDDVNVTVESTAQTEQTREHILLARQVGVPGVQPSAAYSCADGICSCSGSANCFALSDSGKCSSSLTCSSTSDVCWCSSR